MIRSFIIFLKSFPLPVIFWKIKSKLFNIKMPSLPEWQNLLENKKGIEIGGPSHIFTKSGYLPLYPVIHSLDGINFSSSTFWEGNLSEGDNYHFGNKTGHQFILEGSKLNVIKDSSYDFLLSCNNLEHIANPIAAVFEWKRVIRNNGYILLILPNKIANFDHRRPYTTLGHLQNDFKNQATERDMTHLEEILKMHDLKRDPQARPFEKFRSRCENNFENRCMHHHVFDQDLLMKIATFCRLEVVRKFTNNTDHFILLKKP